MKYPLGPACNTTNGNKRIRGWLKFGRRPFWVPLMLLMGKLGQMVEYLVGKRLLSGRHGRSGGPITWRECPSDLQISAQSIYTAIEQLGLHAADGRYRVLGNFRGVNLWLAELLHIEGLLTLNSSHETLSYAHTMRYRAQRCLDSFGTEFAIAVPG